MYYVSAQGVDERMINVHYYYYYPLFFSLLFYIFFKGTWHTRFSSKTVHQAINLFIADRKHELMALSCRWYVSAAEADWLIEYCQSRFGDTRSSSSLSLPTTLRASLSGTSLQTLPELVTPLKGSWSLSPRSCPPTRSTPSVGTNHTPSIAFRHLPPNSARFSYATEGALFISAQLSSDASSERFGYWYDCRSNLAPKHARKHETPPPRVKKRAPSRFKRLCFYLCWCKLCWRL